MISHDSGLLVHELCDINPTHIHVTIPTNYRISRAGGDCCVIHHSDLTEAEIIRIDAVTVTTIPRTLHDVIGTVPPPGAPSDRDRPQPQSDHRRLHASRSRSTASGSSPPMCDQLPTRPDLPIDARRRRTRAVGSALQGRSSDPQRPRPRRRGACLQPRCSVRIVDTRASCRARTNRSFLSAVTVWGDVPGPHPWAIVNRAQ